ncbi:MAG: hypothetical protein WCT12_01010, partial [Verrucomicrobiota bacterium]
MNSLATATNQTNMACPFEIPAMLRIPVNGGGGGGRGVKAAAKGAAAGTAGPAAAAAAPTAAASGAGTPPAQHDAVIAVDIRDLTERCRAAFHDLVPGPPASDRRGTAGGNSGRVVLMGNASIIARGTAPAVGDAGSNGNGGRVVIGSSNASGAAAASIDGGGSIA